MTAPRPGNPFSRRWRGQVPWRRLFWRDMLAIGTVLNLLFSFAALIGLSQGAAVWVAVLLHFAPLPLNLFLVLALLRTPGRPPACSAVAAGWLLLMTVV